MTFKTVIAAAAFALASISAASAATATFDFTGKNDGLRSSYKFSNNGLDLTVTAAAVSKDGKHVAKHPMVGKWDHGLGVLNAWNDNSHMLDGSGWAEFMIFSFSKPVDRLNHIGFSFADRNDHFWLFGHDGRKWTKLLGQTGIPLNGYPATYSFDKDFAGSLFAIGALEHDDEYKIAGLSVSYGDIAPVPLPAGGLLLVTGLLGLGAARRLRDRA